VQLVFENPPLGATLDTPQALCAQTVLFPEGVKLQPNPGHVRPAGGTQARLRQLAMATRERQQGERDHGPDKLGKKAQKTDPPVAGVELGQSANNGQAEAGDKLAADEGSKG